MFKNDFSDTPTFGPIHFYRCYHIKKSLFLTIINKVHVCNRYFVLENGYY
jgi:hypothetical protein